PRSTWPGWTGAATIPPPTCRPSAIASLPSTPRTTRPRARTRISAALPPWARGRWNGPVS
ncbi:hypothetical protein EKE94_18485, partial [Mesobaculum littorinae]